MWEYNSEYNKWNMSIDNMIDDDYQFYLQELSLVRFYSKALSGATYLPVSNFNNIYDVLGSYKARNWYIGVDGSEYTNTLIPSFNAESINATTSVDYYDKFLGEYGLSLKTLFTPKRLIDDAVKNYNEVDVATTVEVTGIGANIKDLSIDGVLLKEGHRVLIKDQKTRLVLANTIDPEVYFKGGYTILRNLGSTIEYEYLDDENGIYIVRNGILERSTELQNYQNCIRFSVVVKLGNVNSGRQYHLSRLKNGYYSIDFGDPFEFVENKNWMLRNKINYNNLFEINHYDIIKHATQSYALDGITYSIPERTITVGEFGTIICHQNGISNLISNKYKTNLRSVSQTSKYYWICGDTGILLRVRKHDFQINKYTLELDNKYSISLRSISFYSDLRGVVVGDLNTIYLTDDSGNNWRRLRIRDFDTYYYTKVIFNKNNNFIIGGKNGVFIEFKETINGWTAYKRRISKIIDDDDDYLLVDNINDLYHTTLSSWNLNFEYFTQSIPADKELIFITTDDSKVIVYDVNKTNGLYDFLYLDLGEDFGDILNITGKGGTTSFLYTGVKMSTQDSGVFSFDLANFQSIGVGNSYSNSIAYTASTPNFESSYFPNELFDYNGVELLMCGNSSLYKYATYSLGLDFINLDDTFENRLKSKLLFLDYDAASKLNFFTDFGDYRLPNELNFRGKSFSSNSILYFDTLSYGPVFPDFLTQSETNWWTYWTDNQKTFEFYNNTNPLDESSMVLISSTFSYSATQSLNNITLITTSASSIQPLAPKIADTIGATSNHFLSRFNAMGLTGISDSLTNDELYLYKYLMVYKTTDFGYPVKVGDMMKFSSSYIEGKFIVNKIKVTGSAKYIYMFTEFNDTIITNLKGYTASIVNLNVYSNVDEFESRFNQHPISKAYFMQSSYVDEITAVNLYPETGITYSNWQVQGLTESTTFAVSGFTTSSVNSLLIDPSSGSGAQTASIISPTMSGVTNVAFSYDYRSGTYAVAGSYSILSVQGLSASTWVEIATYSIPFSLSTTAPQHVDLTLGGTFSQFRFDFTVVERDPIISGYKWISIQDISLYTETYLEVETENYGVTYSNNRILNLSPQFNNYTAYYNLAANVYLTGNQFTMSYTEGFLDFKYTPTYNILSYLEGLNDVGYPNPKFTADKEYYAMPDFRGVPMSGNGIGIATNSVVYLASNGITYSNYTNPIQKTSNTLKFGKDLVLEWQSIFINTFVDVSLWNYTPYVAGAPSSTTERLLVLNKYYDDANELYIIEFHKNINYTLGDFHYFIDITSRRKLKQISDDLQELNNIQKGKFQRREIVYPPGNEFYNYDRELNFKIPTDSYAKVLLSDADTFQSLSAMMYIDYKNEMSMNILNLEEQISVPIKNTANFSGNLFIFCSEKHGLKTNDSVVLEFNGGTASSQQINQNYFGYHPVIVVNEYNFYLDLPYGNVPLSGNDTGFVKYSKQDPFFEFTPVDLIDVGVNKMGKQSIELSIDNQILTNKTYKLVNIDFTKYRFRLIDGLDLNQIYQSYSWLLEAEISDAIIGKDTDIVWYKGVWESGRWFGGTWISGQWISGDWYRGVWDSKEIDDRVSEVKYGSIASPSASVWYNGRWFDGTWNQGVWVDGRWYDGTWRNGTWYRGIWNDGTWNQGRFGGGIWVLGTWNDGVFNTDNEPSYWLDGSWFAGDFENGIWYNGTWNQAEGKRSRFGVNSYNSRTSIWHSGNWLDGEFHSRLNINDNGDADVSDVHKYSIWYTGNWFDGDFYGGVAYNMNWRTGTWHGGILEDIQMIGYGNDGIGAYYITLNGIFKFNIGDEFTIIDNNSNSTVSLVFGRNSTPKTFKVLYKEEDTVNKWTKVYVATSFAISQSAPVDLNLRVVSKFANCNWKSGIWTNGIYKKGLWEGGIWYNGVFEATWM